MSLETLVYIFTLALVLNALFAVPVINLLYRHGFYKTKRTDGVDVSRRNRLWYDHFGATIDTPSSYGILLIVNFFLAGILSFILQSKDSPLFLFVSSTILLIAGLWDDCEKYFLYLKHKHWGLRVRHKLLLQFLVVGLFLVLNGQAGNVLWVSITFLIIIFYINAYNITDGLDGLIGSLSIPVLLAFALVETVLYGFSGYLFIYIVLLGFFIIFHYFNIKPARVWLGDAGALPIGFILGVAMFRYPLYFSVMVSSIFFIEGLSSALQLFWIWVLKKKLFIIAPFHLLLLNKGWADVKIVQRAQLVQYVICIFAVVLLVINR